MENKLIKRVGILISSLGFITFVMTLVSEYMQYGRFFVYKLNFLTLVFSVLMLVTSFYSIGKYFQVVILTLTFVISLYDSPQSGDGMAVLILTLLLMYKYKFLETRVMAKIVGIISLVITALILGLFKLGTDKIIVSVLIVLFFFVFLVSLVIIMYDELAVYIKREKKYKKQIKKLNNTLQETQEYLDKIDAHFIDPVEAGLTKKELILLENLCLYRESNSDLANRLNKSPNTIKVQLTRIMNKIGAETRYQLIDLCRHYYLEKQKIDA